MELEKIFERYGLTPAEYKEFEKHFSFHQYKIGETVFHQGDDSESFFFIKTGELTVSVHSQNEKEKVLNVLSPGDFFGEIGLLIDQPRTASVHALTNVQLYELNKAAFFNLLEKNAAFKIFLDEIHTNRLLQSIPLFEHLDEDALSKIRQELEIREADAGETLVREGENSDAMFLLLQAGATKYRTAQDGTRTSIGNLPAGTQFGEDGLLENKNNEASVVLDGPSRLLVLHKARFQKLLQRIPSISFNVPNSGFLNKILPLFYKTKAYLSVPELAMNRPRLIARTMTTVTLLLVAIAVLPTLFPSQLPFLHGLKVDTDPENMLSADEAARIYHNQMKREFTLHDMLVVGIVNDEHPNGVFNKSSLEKIFNLTELAKTLRWQDEEHPGKTKGVVTVDIMAPSTMDVVEQAGAGSVRFSWLMPEPPGSEEEALAIYHTLKRYPMMDGTMLSADGKAIVLYLPLTAKDMSYRVYESLKKHIATLEGADKFFITGLPVAEDSFGVEMFIQMAISAPLAMMVIFLLMLYFFRSLVLVTSPMILAMVSVLCTMALLIISGNTLHIMSSMIPIFIMPIAVLDSVHILSEFFDFYPRIRDRRMTIQHVMRELFPPMLFTSLTTAMGFASLALVPIPPVQVFGIFVAIGVILAWLLSISFIPAYILMVPQNKMDAMLDAARRQDANGSGAMLPKLLQHARKFSINQAKRILIATLALVALCVYGIQNIIVNDNPVRWFAEGHPIRVADKVLNEHFAGTYMAYLALEAPDRKGNTAQLATTLQTDLTRLAETMNPSKSTVEELLLQIRRFADETDDTTLFLGKLEALAETKLDSVNDDEIVFWEEVLILVHDVIQQGQLFKDPEVLAYIEKLQDKLSETGIVGKSVSIADISKTINRELNGGKEQAYTLPDSSRGVAQTLLTYQSGHRPQDLWRFVTPDYRKTSIWLLLNSGDNQDMETVLESVETFLTENPPPVALDHGWFGLTHINVVWQDKMVNGMLMSIAGSYLTVMLMMTLLLRSTLWGILAMIPLSSSMLVIYGILGLIGKPYDMPVAVLSALAIGLAVDFTIHFLVRMRHFVSQTGSWQQSLEMMFAEPARAISRNILVVAIGFLPLLAAPLVPYNTVGTLIAAILTTSGVATVVILTAFLKTWNAQFFPNLVAQRTTTLGRKDYFFLTIVALLLVIIILQPYVMAG